RRVRTGRAHDVRLGRANPQHQPRRVLQGRGLEGDREKRGRQKNAAAEALGRGAPGGTSRMKTIKVKGPPHLTSAWYKARQGHVWCLLVEGLQHPLEVRAQNIRVRLLEDAKTGRHTECELIGD